MDWQSKFYTGQVWRKFRHALVLERGMRCERCGRLLKDESEIEADHVKELTPETVNNPKVSLNPNNIQLLCKNCHNQKHGRYGYEQKKVFLVYGSPCSGKSSYVKKHMNRGDIVVDMDLLYQAVSGCQLHDKPDNIKAVVFALRDNLLNSIKMRIGKWNHAFVVGGYPYKAEREDLAKSLNAEMVLIDVSKEECLLRASSRGNLADDYREYIERWFDRFER